MGTSKALLPFGAETMLQRVVRLLSTVVSPIVVVAAAEQSLPDLPADVIVTRDEQQGRGPLEGLRAGLKALPETVESAYVTSCDVPLLVPDFVRRMIDLLDRSRYRRDGNRRLSSSAVGGLSTQHAAARRSTAGCRIDCGRCFSSTRSEPAACSRRR